MKLTLNNGLRQELLRTLGISRRSGNVKFSLRLETMLLLSDNFKDFDVEKASEFCLNTVRTIYTWLSIFLTEGIEGLRIKKSSGRKPKLTKNEKRDLKKLILKEPSKFGYDSGIWTCAMIQDLIYKTFNVEYSIGYVNQLLSQINLSHKKVESISHKADKEEQRKFMEETFPSVLSRSLRVNGKILFQDESTFRHWSRVTHSWGERGKPLVAKVNMNSNTQRVFGAIELGSGKFTYKLTKKATMDSFLDYLEHLIDVYAGHKVFLVIDNGKIHNGEKIRRFLSNNYNRIEFIRLPKYSPMLNPIEKLWKKVKQNFMHNKFFETKEAFIGQLKKALKYYENNSLQVASVMKKIEHIYQNIKNQFSIKINDFHRKFSKAFKSKNIAI